MVLISPPPPALSPDLLESFYTTDELLSNAPILAFYGATSTATINSSSSRIQVHIYTPAGLQSYPRLTISPSSPLYAAVNCLAREYQGDEVCRALAFSLYKYFLELSPIAKSTWESQSTSQRRLPSAPPLFSEAHAAILASRMVKVENAAEVVQDFSRQQKENLRRELCEFIDTEENYVGKIYDLLHSVAEDFRQKARVKSPTSSSPSEEALEGLFPPSLDEILNANTSFLEDIRKIIEETENDAIQDIESTTAETFYTASKSEDPQIDVTGTLSFANCLLEWFPKFSDCYTDYIQAHAEFGQYLRIFLRETGSSFSKRVQETGEQRLMSMLIEPLSKVIERLQHLIPSWPQAFRPEGRLVTAMDVVELAPPYRKDVKARGASPAILLLFTDELVLLIKSGHKTMSARGLLAEIDNPSVPLDETPQIATQLIFLQHMKLSNIWFSEVDDGSLLQLYHSDGSSQPPTTLHSLNASSLCMFYLTGSYELKASRWIEETAKAKVECRFPEAERESHKWDVRSLSGDLNLFSAIFEEGEGQITEGRREPARVRIVMDPNKGSKKLDVGEEGVELIASITAASDELYWLEIEAMNDFASRDKVTAAELIPVFSKRGSTDNN
ncbi:putative rho guanyl nucleotide exchange factor protein [Neofusicoccum parvum UCRNP2]|uniref:Putative rho guanyl nucleotide exchange factor protein n=1 Tax=Botryosphaeria parva (strain UCR-NP2) TaxID=1287680 RepID=R1GYW8_BOTPV|nr:putative rho guanyl nucleotide exchange factor protein [Neofusicoccum parvum UCRNP2]